MGHLLTGYSIGPKTDLQANQDMGGTAAPLSFATRFVSLTGRPRLGEAMQIE